MDRLVQRRVEASTLPEVLISMIIIMAVFTIAITIYIKITFSGTSISNRQIQGEMNRIIMESIENEDWEEENINLDSIRYQKTVSPYKDYEDLFIMQITATKHKELIGKMRQIINRKN